jgi:hypothetical protein
VQVEVVVVETLGTEQFLALADLAAEAMEV